MPIDLVSAEEVVGRKGRTKGEKYGKYAEAIKKNIQWIKDNIKKTEDGSIRMKIKDMAKEMGPDFIEKDERSIYNGLKYVLFNEGIFVDMGTHKDGDKILTMRSAIESDKLPHHLAKYLESEGNEEEILE